MKKLFYITILSAIGILCKPSPSNAFDYESTFMQIDSTDTVVFDLSQTAVSGGHVNFPLYINSNDTIYALDFSLKYDDQSLSYDSIIELTTYVQSFSFYNTNDSTLRYTSSSLQPYDINTLLTLVQFDLFTTQISDSDLYEVKAYLNGSECSVLIIPPAISAISENIAGENTVIIYPNPSSSIVNIASKENALIQVLNMNGSPVKQAGTINGQLSFDMNDLADGCYFVKVISEKSTVVKKITKN
jgi:hypothetical protein